MAAIPATREESLARPDVEGSAKRPDTKAVLRESSAVVPTAPANRAASPVKRGLPQHQESLDHRETRTCIPQNRAARRCQDATAHRDIYRRAAIHRLRDRNR